MRLYRPAALAALTALVPITLSTAAPAQAALMEVDTALGAGTGTLDTDQGLVLLDTGLSYALSYDELIIELSLGGMFEGYRLATAAEINGFFDAGGLVFETTGTAAEDAFFAFSALTGAVAIDDFGDGCALAIRLLSDDIAVDFEGVDPDPDSLTGEAPFAALIRPEAGPTDCGVPESEIFRSSAAIPFVSDQGLDSIGFEFGDGIPRISGAALVREFSIDVPAPGAALLFGLAAFGLGLRRKAARK